MIEKHWDGIVAYCHADNKVALGFVDPTKVNPARLSPITPCRAASRPPRAAGRLDTAD